MYFSSHTLAVWRAGRTVCLVLLLVASFGCSGGPKGPTGTVHGKVTYKQQPAPAGAVISFIGEKAGAATATISADGTYLLQGEKGPLRLPTGTYRVIISVPSKEMSIEEGMKASESGQPPAQPTAAIPAKYSDASATPASFEVKEGDNEYNLDMTDG